MKKIIISIIVFLIVKESYSQVYHEAIGNGQYNLYIKSADKPVKWILDQSELIFEGRVLSDSSFCYSPGGACKYHRVLVLKEFKGDFKSDTIEVAYAGGTMNSCDLGKPSNIAPDVHKGMEGVFCVAHTIPAFNNNSNIFHVLYMQNGCGFINVCDKNDVAKEVYKPIEAATGKKYTSIHPNACAQQTPTKTADKKNKH